VTKSEKRAAFRSYVDACLQAFLDEAPDWPEPVPFWRECSVLYRPNAWSLGALLHHSGNRGLKHQVLLAGKPRLETELWIPQPAGWGFNLGFGLYSSAVHEEIARGCRQREIAYRLVDFDLGDDVNQTHFAQLFDSL
jgi:hypothetical protein